MPVDLTPEDLRRMADEIDAEAERNGGSQWQKAKNLAGQYRMQANAIERGEKFVITGSGLRRER